MASVVYDDDPLHHLHEIRCETAEALAAPALDASCFTLTSTLTASLSRLLWVTPPPAFVRHTLMLQLRSQCLLALLAVVQKAKSSAAFVAHDGGSVLGQLLKIADQSQPEHSHEQALHLAAANLWSSEHGTGVTAPPMTVAPGSRPAEERAASKPEARDQHCDERKQIAEAALVSFPLTK